MNIELTLAQVGAIFGTIVTILLGLIVFLLKRALAQFDNRLKDVEVENKAQDKLNNIQQQEIVELKAGVRGLTSLGKETTENVNRMSKDLSNFQSSLITAIVNLTKNIPPNLPIG